MKKLTMVQAINEALREEMLRDENVILIGEDIGVEKGWGGAFGVTKGLSEEFGHDRVRDTPISESAIVGVAIGAAMLGMRPVAEMQYGDFIFCAMDQVVNQAAKMRYMSGGQVKIPLVIRVPTGASGRGAQHAQSLEGFFMHVPGLKIAAPSSPYDAKGLLKSAIRDDNPVLFFEHKLLYGSKGYRSVKMGMDVLSEIPEEEYTIPLGMAEIKRKGDDITVVATQIMVHRSLSAATKLAEEGINVEIFDPRTLVPLDKERLLKSIEKTGRLLIVEEDTKRGGWGSEIAAIIAEEAMDYLDAPIERIATPNTPIPSPPLEESVIPNEETIIEEIRKIAK